MRHAAIRCHETSRGFDLLGLWGADDEIVVGAEHEMDDELTDLEVSTFDRSYLTDRSSGASVVLLPPYHITDREWRTPTAGAIKSGAIWMQMTPLFNFGQSRSLDCVGRLGSVTLSLLGPRTHSPDSFDISTTATARRPRRRRTTTTPPRLPRDGRAPPRTRARRVGSSDGVSHKDCLPPQRRVTVTSWRRAPGESDLAMACHVRIASHHNEE